MERHLALPSSFSLHCVNKVHLYCFILVLPIGLQILLTVGKRKRKLIDINQHLPVRRAVLWGHGYRGLQAKENESMLDFAQQL